MLLCFPQELEAGDQPLKEGLVVEEDQEGAEEVEGAEEQMSHLLVAVGAEEGRVARLRSARAAEEGTSGWEEAGAPWHQVWMEVGVEALLWEPLKEVEVVPLGP